MQGVREGRGDGGEGEGGGGGAVVRVRGGEPSTLLSYWVRVVLSQ